MTNYEIGRTQSGKAVYSMKEASDYTDFTQQDHQNAEKLHWSANLRLKIRWGYPSPPFTNGEAMQAYWNADTHRHHSNRHADLAGE